MLELRLGGNDILIPLIGKFQVPAEAAHELLCRALLEHSLAIGRVADDHAALRRKRQLCRIALAEFDVFRHACLLRICDRNGQTGRINVRAEDAVVAAILAVLRLLIGLRPDLLRHTGPFLRRKSAVQPRRAVQRGQCGFDHDRAGAAEGIPEEVPPTVAREIDQRGSHRLVQRRFIGDRAVAALVQARAGGVQKHLADVLHD